ncbi:MAG: hypothetical protein AABW72_00045 [archaeon]
MADETPRRLKRFERRGEMPPAEMVPEAKEETKISKDDLFGKKPVQEKSYEEEEEEMAEQFADESSVESQPEKPKKTAEDNSEEIIDALGKKSEEEVHEELAKQELGKFKEKFKRMPISEEDYNAIAESIFEQIQLKGEGQAFGELKPEVKQDSKELKFGGTKTEEDKQSRKIRRRGRQAEEELTEKPAAIAEEEPEERGSVSDLFGEKKKSKKKSSSELEELSEDDESEDDLEGSDEEGIDDLGSLDEEADNSSLENIDEDNESCPNCEKPTEEVIYCSSCGAAFCDSCAKSKEKFPDKVKYVCPHCGAKIDKAIKK